MAKKILIVEDDPFLVKAYSVKFQKEGIETDVAKNAEEASAFFAGEPASAVLLDLMLPGTSGFDVLATIRKHATWGKVPVLILTNLGQESDVARGKELGANDYIVKANTKINDIVAKVKVYL